MLSPRQLDERKGMAAQPHEVEDAGGRPSDADGPRTGSRGEDERSERRRGDPYAPHRRTVTAGPAADYPFLRSQRAPSTEPATEAAIPNATSRA